VVDGDAKRAAPGAGTNAASRDHRAVAKRLGMSGVKLGGYQLRRSSKTNSGTGAGASSQRGAGSATGSHSGGPRARASSGGVVGSPRWARIVFRACAWVSEADDAHLGPAQCAAQGEDLIDAR